MLSDSQDDVFNAIFLTKVDNPLLRYDLAAKYPLYLKRANLRISIPPPETPLKGDSPSTTFTAINRTLSILQTALTTRVTLISVTAPSTPPFHLPSTPHPTPTTLTLGFLIDPETSRRLVDHGPPASDVSAATAFRSFWGEKAELRRFKDGSILESVLWTCKTPEDRYLIVKRIVRFVIARHISAGVAGDITFLTPQLWPQVVAPVEVRTTYGKTEGDGFSGLGEMFDGFVRQMKDLKDMPLGISGCVPVGEGLTYTGVYAPYPQNYAKLSTETAGSYYVPVQDVVVQLEGSGKWPDDLRAIQKVKIGLLLHMASQLEKVPSVTTHVGLENPDTEISNTGFLDVVYEQGYTFRVRIQYDPNHREAHLLERTLKNKSLATTDRLKLESALKLYQDNFIRGTAHAQTLHSLRAKFFFLPHSIRLLKRWFAAHMLSLQISAKAIELIVCFVYIHPHPWTSPSSAEVGFLRTLQLLATWDWRKEPITVDFDGSMSADRYAELAKGFEGTRKQDPGIVHVAWSIFTGYDATGSCWTKDQPGKAVAARVTALAKSSLDVLSKDAANVKVISTDMQRLWVANIHDSPFRV